jgi:hypothetical protein
VDNVARRQIIAARNPRITGRTSANLAAFGEEFWPCGAMNCAIDATAAKQRLIRCVDDGVNLELRYIALA